MRWLLLGAIRVYWLVAPAWLRRRCIFRVTCSRHVYDVTRARGFWAGLRSLLQRGRQCRPGYSVEFHAGQFRVRLKDGSVIGAEAFADDVVAPYRDGMAEALSGVEDRLQ
jgi:uncharacterized protein